MKKMFLFRSSLFAVLSYVVLGEQCKPDSIKPCVAQCNGTSFDLSKALDLPMSVSGITWSPCKGQEYPADKGTEMCAVCEFFPDMGCVCCGNLNNPVWIWDTDKMNLSSKLDKFPDWQIEYTNGGAWRMSIFSFVVDETVAIPEVTFVGEDSFTYHFHVIGKCIGQLTDECQKYYDS